MPISAEKPVTRYAIVSFIALVLSACASEDKTGEFYTRWDLAGGCASDPSGSVRHDANGRATDVCDAADGRWVWVTYAAGWCSASRSQAPAVSRLARSPRKELAVFVVLTGGDEVFVPASLGAARAWAAAYGLPPSRVLYDSEEGSRTVPQHLLIGPDGRTWYRYVGFLDTDEMQRLIDDFDSGARLPDVRELPLR